MNKEELKTFAELAAKEAYETWERLMFSNSLWGNSFKDGPYPSSDPDLWFERATQRMPPDISDAEVESMREPFIVEFERLVSGYEGPIPTPFEDGE
jgi:hypothetical protein